MLLNRERTIFKCWEQDNLFLFDIVLHYRIDLETNLTIRCCVLYHKPQEGKCPCVYMTQQSVRGQSSRVGNIIMGRIGAASPLTLHKNTPLEKHAALLQVITGAKISRMISLQKKEEGNLSYSLFVLWVCLSSNVLYDGKFYLNQTII